MIEILDITKQFGQKTVLHSLSARFGPGEVSMIIGSSGSGKSVLMKILVGLFAPDVGKVCYGTSDFFSLDIGGKTEIRKQIGMLFQNSALFDSLNVEQNVLFPLQMFGKQSVRQQLERVNHCLERVGLSGTNAMHTSQLSGGMRKRVGIARAIALEPRYLFCDEPNSGLDPLTSIKIDELIREITLESGITTIVNSHDMNSVMEIGNHICFLFRGKILWTGSKSNIMKTDCRELNDFVFATAFLKQLRTLNTD
ncbi:MAG: ATP-binding cassette domain-containing protein [Sphingomonadales bacterium]|nr:ATP-binding cassette domain-containing protein [Sphingomonadales bacterium]